ncbi:MAG: Ig-like domain repeat protein, partial [Methanobrevibacter sp.]|uniref:Ig-like domain repeat protein n=1 Tax=Methanobrevibacter sp. TaxID=66852 RepID=UPI0025EDA00D
MNKKEILMICLIICFIFSLQAVSAADVELNTTDDTIMAVQSDDTVSISNDLSSYSLPEDNSIVRGENDGAGSFSELQEKIDNDNTGTISLDKNYTYNSSSDSGLTNGIVISKNINIIGNDFTIDALSSARIFNIETGSTVTLTGINFVNGGSASVDYGGSIHSDAQDLTIDDCTFKGSYASEDGGALFISGNGCKLSDSTFIDNTAGDDGGAICWNGDDGTIYNITCNNNTGICHGDSSSRGGAISLTGDNVNISKSTFTSNHVIYSDGSDISKIDGGAIFATGHDVTITDSTFTDCTASNMGGAIYTLGDNNIIKNTTFTNNKASEDGGALYVLGNGTKLYDSTFTDNVAGDDGGAICWNGDDGTIYNITCNNNTGICNDDSNSRGGTISLTGNNVNISKSSITSGRVVYSDGSDSSKIDGGAMFITGDNIIISDTNFTDCTASNDGGAIYALGNNVEIINSIFTNNEVTEDGGALYISGENCKIYNSTLNDNRAGDDGGAIYWEGANGIIDGCDFTDNKGLSAGNPSDPSTSKGGTLSVTGDKLSILNSNFTRGITYNRNDNNVGGAIFITGDDVDIESCNFDECTASDADGGTIYIIGDRTTITNSNISDSTARAGGAIYIDGVYASVIDSSFTNTFAKTGAVYGTDNLGGAIYIKGNYAKISGSDFDESAAYSGGIIYLEGNYCNVSDSSFNGGSASNDGGAMYSTGSYSTVTNSNFTYNGAQGNGGAMYWYGGSNSKYNDILGCLFEENVAYARSSSNTKGGGAIYWSEGGAHDSIKDSKFIRNSVQSDNKADGGAILWDRSNYVVIDNCIFDGDYITTSATGNVWVQGGALYLRVDSKAVINNSVFVNCSSDKEAGALYVQSKSNLDINNPILIENTKFISNVAKAIAPNVYGGGAVQVKECNNIFFTNDSFINNTANNGGALSVYNAAEPVKFIDCVFIGNNATQNGGSIWFNKRLYLYNVTISDSYAENFGGGMYNENAELIHNNLTFINNTALNGGGIYWNRNNINIHDMVFLNNTALQYGGAIYISKGGNSLSNVNMTGNKAFSGSAIYSTAAFTLTNAYLIENQANSSSLTFDSYDESTGKIVLLFKGKDKYLNAIYVTGSNRPTCNNVTYWSENGVDNTGSSAVTLPNAADPTPEAGQNITVGVYDDKGNLLNPDNQYFITDKNGKIYLDFHDIVPGVPSEQYGEIYVEAILTNDDYYTIIKLTSRAPSSINASATNTTYHSNSTLSVNVTHGATGNVSVYLNDTFLGNITLDDSKGSINISTLIEGSYLPAGNHTLSFVYGGNAKYDKSNTTAILEISKITPTLLVNVTGIGYNLVVNVTVMDGRYNISDATGNVTIEVAGRTTTIYLANGQGMTVIYGLPIGNYTVNATYNGDNNYYSTSNSTYGNVTEKTQTVLLLEVDNDRTYFINETVPIKVTILPNAEGNITLYINGEPHVLALQTVDNSTFVEFNATDLKDGINHVFATYEGTGLYAPSWAQDTFNVTKFNATVEIKTENITLGDTEVINITVPEDATGILNVTVNGTPYYIEIINGNATLPISGLSVGVYNVTVTFVGDKKYYNATNSTLFNVSKATPSINVTVENITYGEDAIVIVTVPEGQSGNVTIKLNETVVFTQEPIDGQATFTLKNLSASNYTIEATFNGNENYTIASNSTNFTVFKATPELNVTVEDIYYGDAEHIIIKVNTGGNVTVKVNGTETILNITSSGNETYVYDLAVGNYPVEVTFNGNENYTEVTVTKDFNVYQVNTTLDVDVHDIVVWDKESINVTLAKNATGNVIININGVNHTVPIANGTAQLNLTNLTVGHKVVWVFYDGDRNYTANRTMAEFDVGQRTPKVNVTALNITVDQDGKITINIPANATGFVILSGNFTKHPIYVDEFTNGVAEITVDDLAVGKYSVHIKYYGDALDNYTVAENDTTFTVGKINATVTIDADNVTYGNDTAIVVTVPDGVTGNITLKLNDTAGRSITLPIVDGKVTWIVDGLAAGNYTVNATYNGNDDYNINDTESAKFEVKKADPDLNFIVSGTVHDNATVLIFINDEIHGKVVNVTVDGVLYPNVSVDDEFITHVLTEYKPYTIIVEYGGNENFTDARVEHTFTPSKVTTYGINITAMNITVGDDEIITVEVPDNVDDVVIWVNGTKYRNTSFSDNKATFNVTGLKEGIYTVTATVNDTEFEHYNFTTIFTVSKTYPSINITVVNETSIYVNDTVKVIVTVPSDATEDVTIEINGMKFTNSTVNGNATFYIPEITFGNKTIVATYPGDDKYRFNSTTANFTVNKRQSQVNVTVDAGLVGDDTVINVTIPANATGYV